MWSSHPRHVLLSQRQGIMTERAAHSAFVGPLQGLPEYFLRTLLLEPTAVCEGATSDPMTGRTSPSLTEAATAGGAIAGAAAATAAAAAPPRHPSSGPSSGRGARLTGPWRSRPPWSCPGRATPSGRSVLKPHLQSSPTTAAQKTPSTPTSAFALLLSQACANPPPYGQTSTEGQKCLLPYWKAG